MLGVIYATICDEPGMIGMNDSSEVDEHPDNIAEYRVRMKAKYGTIAEFNRRMGTAYDSFDQVKPGRLAQARKSGKYGEFIEWRNFNVDRWCEAVKLSSDATRVHAELIPPEGEARFFLKRNLIADNGKAEFRIRIAENDLDGVWTLKVTDVLTGVSAEKKLLKKTR